ncbi:matrix [Keuraliba virus]|uniref:Matrix protein n=1 Tax=Keuraliba virus TaxID=380440 RepID=A0A0D3R293_9RHAB|nr:matrix [Keuraliba virus]AJR28570.1 matrix [Keuraliba virus]
MFSRLRRGLARKTKDDDETLFSDPPAYDQEDFFTPLKPSAPPPDEETLKLETLHVEAELVVKTQVGIRTMSELLQILGVWIDQCSGPVRQRHLDLWVYLCLGLHVRKDPGVKSHNVYRSALDAPVTFAHSTGVKEKFAFSNCTQNFFQKFKGKDCDIDFTCKLTETKRRGVPAHVIYNQVLKNGAPPPPPTEIFSQYEVDVKLGPNGEHEIFAHST